MQQIPVQQVVARLRTENPWWSAPHDIPEFVRNYTHREYFLPLLTQVRSRDPRRALVLLGPRRVGKTVLIYQVIQALLRGRIEPTRIAYISVDHPIYNGLGLDELVTLVAQAAGWGGPQDGYLFFDEIQYLREWERHLKRLVDDRPELKVVVSGSAAAALRLRSRESGAGRFTEFLLPPLTFHEQLTLRGRGSLVSGGPSVERPSYWLDLESVEATDIDELNREFVQYVNFGGYPEVLFSEPVRTDMQRFVKSDIVDKVLLRDLPGLYGISDIQELNYLFTTLAFNSGNEVSLEELSQNSGVTKNTIKRYIEYLQAAFLIQVVHRVDQRGKRFQRANFFKVHLTNVSMRTALFAPVDAGAAEFGRLVETAVLAQWFHEPAPLFFARWNRGEIDLVCCPAGRVEWAVEVKWSDRPFEDESEIRPAVEFCRDNALTELVVTTRTKRGLRSMDGVTVRFVPACIYACAVGQAMTLLRLVDVSFPEVRGTAHET